MSLFSSLSSGATALNAQSYAIQIAGKNLANVNNADYARERVVFGTGGLVQTSIGAVSFDLAAKSVAQIRDAFLDQQVAKESSIRNALQTEQEALQRAQAGLGESVAATSGSDIATGSNSGLSAQLASFFDSFQSLAASPTDVGERQTLLQNAAILTDTFRQTDANLTQVQADLNAQIQSDTSDVNTLLNTIATLNGQIARFEGNQPGSAVDLRDQRQQAIEQLAAKLSFETRPATNGYGQIQIVAQDTGGNDVVLLDNTVVNNAVVFNGASLTAGGTALALASGSVKGALDARDGAIQTLRSNLDALAGQLVTSVNAAYNPGGATGDFFVAGGTTAGTIVLAAGLTTANLKASAGGNAGDNTVALAVANLASKSFSTAAGDAFDGTFIQFYSGAISDFGQVLSGLNARVDNQTAVENLVRSQRDSVSGVSLDEETTDLMKYQRSFQATSRFINVIDGLLEQVVNRLGAT
ncbi:MAG: flagellar hook-associated protein FlgK [Opitutaceae bacterium]|nr:flagellar hook-associated protein FlgK [Opitutaceae bacterium]